MTEYTHIPVLLNEMLHFMAPQDSETYVDGTFGAGGYSKALLAAANCSLYAIDRDPEAKIRAEKIAQNSGGRFKFLQGTFGNMQELLADQQVYAVDGIVLDIGVSSMQLDNAERGFSFMHEGRLDMRMSKEGIDAHYLINTCTEEELADIFYKYGDEHFSRRIARKIVQEREQRTINTTKELAEIISSSIPRTKSKIHPATKCFQALRIYINDELNELSRALHAAENLLKTNGRLVVISFHSLEDQIVKSFLNERSGKMQNLSRYLPVTEKEKPATFVSLTKSAVKPQETEISSNRSARSARLRAARKTGDQNV